MSLRALGSTELMQQSFTANDVAQTEFLAKDTDCGRKYEMARAQR